MATIDDWELLRVLLETARAGGFRRAEAKLGLTQPTIGKKIDRLEQMVGTQLVVRTTSGISLTPEGEDLCRVAEEMERLTAHALGAPSVRASGRIRVAMTDAMGGYWLPRQLQRFHRDHPHITIDLRCLEFGEEVDLSAREADITVMYRYPTDLDVVVLREAVMELAPMCTQAFEQEWGRPQSLADCRNFPVIAQPFHYHKVGAMTPWAEMLEDHPMVIYRTASSVVSALVSRMGIGISLQPVGVLDREPGVALLDLDGYRCHLPFYLVCHRNVKDAPAIRAVIRYLQDTLFDGEGDGSPSKLTTPPDTKAQPAIAEAAAQALGRQ